MAAIDARNGVSSVHVAARLFAVEVRRPHVSGALGAAILAHFFERRWLSKQRGSRAVDITGQGRAAFVRLGFPLAD